jgi:hypothetical protein
MTKQIGGLDQKYNTGNHTGTIDFRITLRSCKSEFNFKYVSYLFEKAIVDTINNLEAAINFKGKTLRCEQCKEASGE